ncbi:MAG: hypothetical protein R2860_04800 [Desulfobacterales bacterium]
MGWTGKSRLDAGNHGGFEDARTLSEFLETAMNMEKGAERFIVPHTKNLPKAILLKTLDVLAGA